MSDDSNLSTPASIFVIGGACVLVGFGVFVILIAIDAIVEAVLARW